METLLATQTLVVWTLVVAAAIVVALAGYLIAVAFHLRRAGGSNGSNLAKLAAGLGAVSANTAPLEERLTTTAGALSALDERLARVAAHLGRVADAVDAS